MKKANEHIRKAAKEAGLTLWMIAAEIGITEVTLVKWLRLPLPEDKEQRIMAAIKKLEREV